MRDFNRYAEHKRKHPHIHWVCFKCRKMFRIPKTTVRPVRGTPCPQCRSSMIDIGSYFEPPKQSDRAMWELMRALVEDGYRFKTEGSRAFLYGTGSGRKPSKRTVMRRIRELLGTGLKRLDSTAY